jgi:hypothetical protein
VAMPEPSEEDLKQVLGKLGITCGDAAISGDVEQKDALGMTTGTLATGPTIYAVGVPTPPPPSPVMQIVAFGVMAVVTGGGGESRKLFGQDGY